MIKVRNVKSFVLVCACIVALPLLTTQSFASGGAQTEKAHIDPGNKSSLQRGARNFMNYCSGCHSAQYVRFNTIGKYLELSDEQLIDNLMFNADNTFSCDFYGASTSYKATSTGTVADTNWHHIACVRDGNTIRLYIDGTQDGTGDVTGVTLHNSTEVLCLKL